MISYETFRQSCLDLSVLGLHDSPKSNRFAAKSDRVLAWLMDSPIHFCQMANYGETVFTANPNGAPEEQLLPVAADIDTFIGLLIACKDAALIASAPQWSRFRFQELTDAVTPTVKAQSVIRALENIYHPPVIQDPGALMADLRKNFPTSHTDLHIGFDTDFTQISEKAGKEVAVSRSVSCENGTWSVPSIYLCDEGIVVDTVLQMPIDSLRNFRKNWSNRNNAPISLGDKFQLELDDPMTAAVSGTLTINDKALRCKSSYQTSWDPFADNDPHVRRLLNHYHLDFDQGYLFRRYCFLKKGKYPQIRTMQLTLQALPVMVPDEIFRVHKDGMRFRFIHPATGLEHIFTAVSLTQEALNPNFLTNHPCFYSRLNYTLEPSISPDNFRVVDRAPSDYWDDYQEEPAAVVYFDRKPDAGRYALSSLHYEPQKQIHWQLVFRRKLHQDLELKLLP